jgi:hypothetical protein
MSRWSRCAVAGVTTLLGAAVVLAVVLALPAPAQAAPGVTLSIQPATAPIGARIEATLTATGVGVCAPLFVGFYDSSTRVVSHLLADPVTMPLSCTASETITVPSRLRPGARYAFHGFYGTLGASAEFTVSRPAGPSPTPTPPKASTTAKGRSSGRTPEGTRAAAAPEPAVTSSPTVTFWPAVRAASAARSPGLSALRTAMVCIAVTATIAAVIAFVLVRRKRRLPSSGDA